jgi:hypothetical protein
MIDQLFKYIRQIGALFKIIITLCIINLNLQFINSRLIKDKAKMDK